MKNPDAANGARAEIEQLYPKDKELALPLAPSIHKVIQDFIIDGKSGNVLLNVKDGRILACRTEAITSAKA